MQLLRILFALVILVISLPSPSPVQAQSCTGDTYVIRAGDSLFTIAERCGIPYAALVGINVEISDPDKIYPGQVIRLVASVPLERPKQTGPAEDAGLQDGGADYIVRSGDSLARIAYLYHTTIYDLRQANPEIGPGNAIHPGQIIHMPPDAKKEKGWVGVNTRIAEPGDEIEVRVVDFPPYGEIEIRLAEFGVWGDLYIYETLKATTDAKGSAWIEVELPFYAWYDEEWVVEVVYGVVNPDTGEEQLEAHAVSPIILIDNL